MGKLSNFFDLFKRNLSSKNNNINDESILNEYENVEYNLKENDYNSNQIDSNENINVSKEQSISNYTLNNTFSNESDFLKLFKYDSIADSSKTFNIETALNNNWDKVDNFAKDVSQEMEHKADLDENGKVLTSQLPEISSSADGITITDMAGNFISDNVEGALAELFKSANNGKTAIRNAMSGKGVTVSLEDTFTLLASKITAQMCKFSGTAIANDVLSGKTFINSSGNVVTGNMTNQGAASQALITQGQQYTIPSGYHNGSGKVTANISNLVASNIKNGVNVGGVVGTVPEAYINTNIIHNIGYFSNTKEVAKWNAVAIPKSGNRHNLPPCLAGLIQSTGIMYGKSASLPLTFRFTTNAPVYIKMEMMGKYFSDDSTSSSYSVNYSIAQPTIINGIVDIAFTNIYGNSISKNYGTISSSDYSRIYIFNPNNATISIDILNSISYNSDVEPVISLSLVRYFY